MAINNKGCSCLQHFNKCCLEGERILTFDEWTSSSGQYHTNKTITELITECKVLGIKKYSNLKKNDLLRLLFDNEYSFYDEAYILLKT
jgi:hypothetical protein